VATYATEADLEQYLAPNRAARLAPVEDPEGLLRRAERDVDRLLGPYARVAATGLKLDPAALTAAQRAALARATCAAAEFRLMVGEEELVGDTDYVPATLVVLRRAGRVSPKAAEELSGHGLVRYSGCAAPTPEPVAPVA
jgi:hypothetical protein